MGSLQLENEQTALSICFELSPSYEIITKLNITCAPIAQMGSLQLESEQTALSICFELALIYEIIIK